MEDYGKIITLSPWGNDTRFRRWLNRITIGLELFIVVGFAFLNSYYRIYFFGWVWLAYPFICVAAIRIVNLIIGWFDIPLSWLSSTVAKLWRKLK